MKDNQSYSANDVIMCLLHIFKHDGINQDPSTEGPESKPTKLIQDQVKPQFEIDISYTEILADKRDIIY